MEEDIRGKFSGINLVEEVLELFMIVFFIPLNQFFYHGTVNSSKNLSGFYCI